MWNTRSIQALSVGGLCSPLRGGALPRPKSSETFGVPGSETHLGLQTDSFQEIVNKLAWVLGSTYRVQYSNRRSPARLYAQRIATAIVKAHGYPSKISTS